MMDPRNMCLLVIIEAEWPHHGGKPRTLKKLDTNKYALDWIVEAFKGIADKYYFVKQYKIDEIINRNPKFDYDYDLNQKDVLFYPVCSILSAPLIRNCPLYVSYTDIIFRRSLINRLSEQNEGDLVIVVDKNWKDRYTGKEINRNSYEQRIFVNELNGTSLYFGRQPKDNMYEFAGIMKFSASLVNKLLDLPESTKERLKYCSFLQIMQEIVKGIKEIRTIDECDDWSKLQGPKDIAQFILGTKSETLERLQPMVRKSMIGDQLRFTVSDWNLDSNDVIGNIGCSFSDKKIIIRSSALTEDGWDKSNAGAYESVLNVSAFDTNEIKHAVDKVISSYNGGNNQNQILVQEMLNGVIVSGVVFTRTLTHGAPYYVINYDDKTSNTNTVSGGNGDRLKTIIIKNDDQIHTNNIFAKIIIEAVVELENLIGYDSLDIEFAITNNNMIHILQIRPLVNNNSSHSFSESDINRSIDSAISFYLSTNKSNPFLMGNKRIFGVMSDWNPAEIIGVKPKQLSFSLYRYLITDQVWAIQRQEYGYRDLSLHPLLISFAGHPYVDIITSFNSFIPADLPDRLCEKLVDYYSGKLIAHPELHDKVEFDIVFTCFTFDLADRLVELIEYGFSEEELNQITESLRRITIRGIQRYKKDLLAIDKLKVRYENIIESDLDPLDKAVLLLEDCKKYGTLPFSHLARGGFVAISLLKSLKSKRILSDEDLNRFMVSINTVSKKFQKDALNVSQGTQKMESFVETYGHLRPGTYEITSSRYDNEPDRYLWPAVNMTRQNHCEQPGARWNENIIRKIDSIVELEGLANNSVHLLDFLSATIEGREYAKFVFTKNISTALELIAEFGESNGLSREQLSFISIHDLIACKQGIPVINTKNWLLKRCSEGERAYRITQSIELPPLIRCKEDFKYFERNASEPNYVTINEITADVVNKDQLDKLLVNLDGKIILIPQADPGFDWLFGRSIGGLITMYGGANSHMAIRAAEFNLPAAIGVGENLYETLTRSLTLRLDCSLRNIEIIR